MPRRLPPSAINLIPQRTRADCAIVCLAMFLGHEYEEVLIAAYKSLGSSRFLDRGLEEPEMIVIADELGHAAKWVRGYDTDSDSGILSITTYSKRQKKELEHVVMLLDGAVLDPWSRGAIQAVVYWHDPAVFLQHHHAKAGMLMVEESD